MKTYEVEVQRISYITLLVDAENEDDAQASVLNEVESGYGAGEYSVTMCEEINE